MTSPAGDGGVLVVVPTYNEYDNLIDLVERIRTTVPTADILIVDDASPDGTGKLADTLAADDDHLHVLHRLAKQGIGVAYVAGYGWGMARSYERFVQMDADGSHLPEQIPHLLDRLADADLVIGSRWVYGGGIVNWSRRREWLSRGGNLYARWMLDLPVRDATGGFRAFRRRTLDGLALGAVASQGYCFQVDLARRAVGAGFRVTEVPIRFVERRFGDSKMSGGIVVEALWRVTLWGLRHRLRQMRDVRWRYRRSTR
ncbi:MAG TPA: polyprenol monophosphomannose synthase [Nocardioidaceae bacterium]|nr:polyprenol monophosphomannose synthase [Nocardioidaceae bacterium]